jgi:hypothetical protein
MINIERSILVSVLEHDFIDGDSEIMKVALNSDYFEYPHHKIFVKAINRLKELSEPICSDTMRDKFINARGWDKSIVADISMEESLLNIMVSQPFTKLSIFNSYYNVLKVTYERKMKIKTLMYV